MKNIVVVGDVTIDLFKISDEKRLPKDINKSYEQENIELYYGKKVIAKELSGGALLLAEMIKDATNEDVFTYKYDDIKSNPSDYVHTITDLSEYAPVSGETINKDVRYRAENFDGFINDSNKEFKSKNLKINYSGSAENKEGDFIVIHDARNYYRFIDDFENITSKINDCTLLIHKMSHPIAQGVLWSQLLKYKDQLVVVILADDLRAKGLRISRSLSWERSAIDLKKVLEKIRKNEVNDENLKHLKDLMDCKYVIIRFGIDGAILYQRKGAKYTIFYYPEYFEGGLEKKYPGDMKSLGIAFTSGLVLELQKFYNMKYYKWIPSLLEDRIEEGIKMGLIVCDKLFEKGFKVDGDGNIEYYYKEMFHDVNNLKKNIETAPVPEEENWEIIDEKIKEDKVYNEAVEIVMKGESDNLKVPVAKISKLITADRSEMESYHSIKNLINEYLIKENVDKPLSIAVFGPPGSGKSFGVTQIAESISENIEKLEFNLSQFKSPEDLFTAFHNIQSSSLKEKVPLVFFDEFDSPIGDVSYGWLKYFLTPMNDGKFKKGEVFHPIGRCIFVFAGGIKRTFIDFKNENKVKGFDFISRLRGYVNIVGINKENENDTHYMIRRAFVLRNIIEEHAKHILKTKNNESVADIDCSVLNALIKVPEYYHGNRSLTAIVEMSTLSDKIRFDRSSLPSSEQLELHVDKKEFKKYLNNEQKLAEDNTKYYNLSNLKS